MTINNLSPRDIRELERGAELLFRLMKVTGELKNLRDGSEPAIDSISIGEVDLIEEEANDAIGQIERIVEASRAANRSAGPIKDQAGLAPDRLNRLRDLFGINRTDPDGGPWSR